MSILEAFTPSLEVYSIDEAFLELTGVCAKDPIAYGQHIRKTVFRTTGIPCWRRLKIDHLEGFVPIEF
jgi:DNA polymerase V